MQNAEREVFGKTKISPQGVHQLIMQRGDINHISLDLLGPALNSDYFIVFSGSYLRGPLLEFLVKKQAINIHAGISPYFRGMACNFGRASIVVQIW